MKDYAAEKFVRDTIGVPIYDGTNDELRHFMSSEL